MTPSNYTREEEERLLASLRADRHATCPRCGGKLVSENVPPKQQLPYVRDRVWFICRGCRRTVVLDRRRIEERP